MKTENVILAIIAAAAAFYFLFARKGAGVAAPKPAASAPASPWYGPVIGQFTQVASGAVGRYVDSLFSPSEPQPAPQAIPYGDNFLTSGD